jgi:hypothetical protein
MYNIPPVKVCHALNNLVEQAENLTEPYGAARAIAPSVSATIDFKDSTKTLTIVLYKELSSL